MRVIRDLPPEVEHHFGDRRPRPAGNRMGGLVAVAAIAVRHPAERPEIGHADGERLAGPRHGRREEGRVRHRRAEGGNEPSLGRPVKNTRMDR